jgi:hypothetical protein
MQEIVGGYIQIVGVLGRWNLICNEEGKLLDLPLNRYIVELRDIVAGTFFIASGANEDGNFKSFSDEEASEVMQVFSSLHIY